ncbi:MAG: hypothetical protein Q8P39_02055 [Candidatus Yanofskybacteria bacterium]|nr:hypothetical protein [Candidatus Yanofskybacteria bacterium]
MKAIQIPKEYAKEGGLVVIPKKEYERLLELKEFYSELDRDLDKAISSYQKGEYSGPFASAEEGQTIVREKGKKKYGAKK